MLGLGVRVAQGWEKGTILVYMVYAEKSCLHMEGLRAVAGAAYLCPVCGEVLDLDGVAGWVRGAEEARDGAYSKVEVDEFGEIVREELQREVYRRRRVMYELQSGPRVTTARPEMLLVVHDVASGSYGCRIFYKEPRPIGVIEELNVGAVPEAISRLLSDPDPVVRLVSGKVEEFHALRQELSEEGLPAPQRRVFYANEF